MKQTITTAPTIPADAVNLCMEEPELIDQADPTVTKWGPYREPKVYRLPGGNIGCTFSVQWSDAYSDHGKSSPLFVSADEGRSWRRSEWPDPGLTGLAPSISPIFDGEFWCLPVNTGIQFDPAQMPRLAGTLSGYTGFPLYRLAEFPQEVIDWYTDFPAVRYSPRTCQWTAEKVQWGDHAGQLVYAPGHHGQKVFLEDSVVCAGTELLYGDYWTQYQTGAGEIPHGFEASLMVSTDNARSWSRRSRIVNVGPGDSVNEPGLAQNHAGELICVLRRDLGGPDPKYAETWAKPMYLVHSTDQGHTWSPPQFLHDRGVLPRLRQLDNGIMVLSYGRPGVWLSFSLDGGHSWTHPHPIVQGDTIPWRHTCGYTSLLPLSRDTFLLTYSHFLHPSPQGHPCKSILTQRFTVTPASR